MFFCLKFYPVHSIDAKLLCQVGDTHVQSTIYVIKKGMKPLINGRKKCIEKKKSCPNII